MHPDDADEAVLDAFLEGQPRAQEWKALRQTLQERLQETIVRRDALPENDGEFRFLTRRIAELRRQVEALRQEEAVSEFVEDTVRAALARPSEPSE